MSYWKYYKINKNSKKEKRKKTFQKLRDQNKIGYTSCKHDYGYELRMPIML